MALELVFEGDTLLLL